MMIKQNRNTIDGLDETELNNKSPDDLCFDPSDASITPSSDKSIPNNVLDVLVKLGDRKANNDPKSTADTNNADQSEAVLLEDTVSNLLDKIIEKRVNQRLSELGITDSNGSLNKSSIEEIEEKNSKQNLKAPNITASKEIVKRKFKYHPETKTGLYNLCRDESIYLGDIDTSKITDMRGLFKDTLGKDFSGIESWDVSKVTDMGGMFYNSSFNQDISSWDVSNVKNMSCMFYKSSFNQDISSWDVSNVENMSRMFSYSSFNQDISSWDITNVKLAEDMFKNTPILNKNKPSKIAFKYHPKTKEELEQLCRNKSVYLGDIDTSKITDMSGLFEVVIDCYDRDFDCYDGDFSGIELWDVSNVKDMRGMFVNSSFNQDISSWDVSNVTDMSYMFSGSDFNQDISSWDVSNVKNMSHMFYYSGSSFNQDISSWDVSNVKNMSGMFSYSSFNKDISSWDVSNVKNMSTMFSHSCFNQDISSWDVSNVENMSGMFCESPFNQDISSWDVSNVKNMSCMFYKSSFNQDISSWDVSNVKDMREMFSYSSFNHDISSWNVPNDDKEALFRLYELEY